MGDCKTSTALDDCRRAIYRMDPDLDSFGAPVSENIWSVITTRSSLGGRETKRPSG